jgi:hypothetical protein
MAQSQKQSRLKMLDRNGKEIKVGTKAKWFAPGNIGVKEVLIKREFHGLVHIHDGFCDCYQPASEIEIIEESAIIVNIGNTEAPCHTCKRKNYLDAKNCWCCGSTKVFHLGASHVVLSMSAGSN